MKTKTVRLAVTVLHEGEYREPGAEITLPIEEANDLLARFGAYDDIPGESVSPSSVRPTFNPSRRLMFFISSL